MRIAAGTARLGSNHAIGVVSLFRYGGLIDWLEEAWPTGTRIKLGLRAKEWLSAAHTGVSACDLGLPVLAGKGRLGSRFASHLILLG